MRLVEYEMWSGLGGHTIIAFVVYGKWRRWYTWFNWCLARGNRRCEFAIVKPGDFSWLPKDSPKDLVAHGRT